MPTPARVMTEIYDLLAIDQCLRAQQRVLEIETAPSTNKNPVPLRLPLSVLERVLRASVANNQLTEEYELWCKRTYGPVGWARLSAELGIDPHG
jgi:uncharacterized protein (DUF2384 family)